MIYTSDILLELTFSVRSEMSEFHLLSHTLSFFTKKLNCQSSLIIPKIGNTAEPKEIVIFPKAFKEQKSYDTLLSEINSIINQKEENDLIPHHFKHDSFYVTVFNLSVYGFFVTVKLKEFPVIFVNSLIPVFQFYGDTLTNAYRQEYQQKIERQLLQERKLFKTILDNIPLCVSLKDTNGARVISNKAELISLNKKINEEVIGKKDDAFYSEEVYQRIREEDNFVIQNKEAIYNKEVKNSEGNSFLISKIPHKRSTGEVEGVITLALDVTVNKRKEQDLLFFKEIINQSTDAIILNFDDGHFYYCNTIAKSWLGISEDDFLKLTYQDFDSAYMNADANTWESHVKGLADSDSITNLTEFVNRHTKTRIPVEVKKKQVLHNGQKFIVSICRDVSEHMEAEELIADEIRFQNLLLKISSTYINTPLTDVEETIQQSLKEIGLFVKADRSYIFDYDDALESSSNTFEWCAEGIVPEIENLQNIPTYNLSDWLEKHKNGLPFLVENVDELPDEGEFSIKQILAAQGIKSLITIPMLNQDRLVGFVGFDSVKEFKLYSEKEKKLLSLYADLLVNIKNRQIDAIAIKNQEERFRSIIQSVDLGLIEVNNQFDIIFVNENLTKLYEYEIDEVINKNALDVFLEDEVKANLFPKLIDLKTDETLNIELPTLTKSGKTKFIYISIGIKTNEQGNPVGYTGALLDVTTQRRLEQDLQLAKEKAENASLEKDKFLANMSHEMRTPLNIINGMISELLLLSNESSGQTFLLKQTKEASNHLLNLVNNALDMAKINAGEMNLTNIVFDLQKVVEDSFSILSTLAKQKNIQYTLDFNPSLAFRLKGDSVKISQVLVNLLNNAIRYTHRGSVELRVDLVSETSSSCEVKFQINDTGIGMSKAFLDVLFTEFSTEGESSGSTGLGMPIAKKIIDLMGGSINIQSEKGKGTKVTFVVKFDKSKLPANKLSGPKSIKSTILKGKKIVVVEDNQMNALIAKKQLERKKAEVVCKNNGLEAIEYLATNSADLILMDIQMPIMDGIECTSFLRNELNFRTPIIALTANVFKNDLENYLKIGINDYLTKPFKEEVLQEKCAIQLSKSNSAPDNLSFDVPILLDLTIKTERIDLIASNDESFKKELFDTFTSLISLASKEIKQIKQEDDMVKLKRLLHKIKPSLQDFGLEEFTSTIYKIMKAEKFNEVTTEVERLKLSLLLLSLKLNALNDD